MKNPYVKWTLIILFIIIVIVAVYYLIQAIKPQPVQPPQGGPPQGGNNIANILASLPIGQWLSNLFGGGKGGGNMGNPACSSSDPGFDNNGYYTRACGGVPGGGGANCNPDSPGKDMDGFLSSQCGG